MKFRDLFQETIKNSKYQLSIFSEKEVGELRRRIFLKEVKGEKKLFVKCIVRKKDVFLRPKEAVRQLLASRLMGEYQYQKEELKFEYPVMIENKKKKADIVVFKNPLVEIKNPIPYLVVDIKNSKLTDAKKGLRSFCNATKARFGIWTNGEEVAFFCRRSSDDFREIDCIPIAGRALNNSIRKPNTQKGKSIWPKSKALDALFQPPPNVYRQKLELIDKMRGNYDIFGENWYVKLQNTISASKLAMQLLEKPAYASLIVRTGTFMKEFNSPLIESINATQNHISKIGDNIQSLASVLAKTSNINEQWLVSKKALIDSADLVAKLLEVQIEKTAGLATLSSVALSRLSGENFGKRISATVEIINMDLKPIFYELAKAHSSFYKSFIGEEQKIISFPPSLFTLPAESFYCSAEFLNTIFCKDEDDDEFKEEIQKRNKEIDNSNKESIEKNLMELDPKFVKMLKGARQALNSDNDDRVRHYSVSMRELITQILHRLAPDESIKKWSQDNQYYDSNHKPKRRARLLFICRNVNYGSFEDYFEIDVKATLKLIALLQKGTHGLDNTFSESQLNVLALKLESLIASILFVAKLPNRPLGQ